MTFIPNAFALSATDNPISPNPMMPIVLPCSPSAFEYSFLFHIPSRRSITPSAIRRSMASNRPKVNSATATAFFPGMLQT